VGRGRYILGTQRGQLKQYEAELLRTDWQEVQSGLEVKRVDSPDGKEVYILCRSRDRAEKERAIHDRIEQRIEEALKQMARSWARGVRSKERVEAKIKRRRYLSMTKTEGNL